MQLHADGQTVGIPLLKKEKPAVVVEITWNKSNNK